MVQKRPGQKYIRIPRTKMTLHVYENRNNQGPTCPWAEISKKQIIFQRFKFHKLEMFRDRKVPWTKRQGTEMSMREFGILQMVSLEILPMLPLVANGTIDNLKPLNVSRQPMDPLAPMLPLVETLVSIVPMVPLVSLMV